MRLLSIDPGVTTGFALGHYDDETPWTLDEVWVTHEGIHGFAEWFWNHGDYPLSPTYDAVVMETFVLRDNGFLASLDGVEIIGFAKGMDFVTRWQPRTAKSFSRTDKKAADNLLKRHDMWHTGKQVGHKDGRDVNDAIIHALAFMKHSDHRPTLEKYFGES